MTIGRLCTTLTADPDEVRNAVKAMRRMAKLGRMAERALEELKSKGSCGMAPVLYKLGTFGRAYNATVNMESLEPFQEVTRGEIPGYGEHAMTFSDYDRERSTIKVCLTGDQILFMSRSAPVIRPIPADSEIATIILKKSSDAISVYPHMTSSLNIGSSRNAQRVGSLLAKRVADLVIETDDHETVRGIELHQNLVKWLVDDGHAISWVRKIRETVSVVRTMSC